MNPVATPKTKASNIVTIRAAICNPPCLTGSVLKYGVRPFLPPQKIPLIIPPRIAIQIPSKGYPLTGSLSENLS